MTLRDIGFTTSGSDCGDMHALGRGLGTRTRDGRVIVILYWPLGFVKGKLDAEDRSYEEITGMRLQNAAGDNMNRSPRATGIGESHQRRRRLQLTDGLRCYLKARPPGKRERRRDGHSLLGFAGHDGSHRTGSPISRYATHSCRHTYATHLYRASGADLEVLQ